MHSEETMKPHRYGLPKMRRAALERLARAYAEDDLDLEDYEDRTEALEAAGSLQEVARVMADIPDFHPETLTTERAGPPAVRPSFVGPVESRVDRTDAVPATAIQILGDRTVGLADFRNGRIRVFCLLGDTKIDLADLRPGETAFVKDFGVLGDFTLRVPAGTEVVRRRIVLLGDEKRVPQKKLRKTKGLGRGKPAPAPEATTTTPASRAPVPPKVVIEGFRLLGDTKIIDL